MTSARKKVDLKLIVFDQNPNFSQLDFQMIYLKSVGIGLFLVLTKLTVKVSLFMTFDFSYFFQIIEIKSHTPLVQLAQYRIADYTKCKKEHSAQNFLEQI